MTDPTTRARKLLAFATAVTYRTAKITVGAYFFALAMSAAAAAYAKSVAKGSPHD